VVGAQEAGLPVHFHIGSAGELPELMTPERIAAHGSAGTQAFVATDLFMKNGVQCADLITCGMLRGSPSSSSSRWRAAWGGCRSYWRRPTTAEERAAGSEGAAGALPSELFAQHVFITYWFEQIAPKYLLDVIPIDNILFETDFPHTTCLYENIDETIAHGLGHVSGRGPAEDHLGQLGPSLRHRGPDRVTRIHRSSRREP